MSGKPMCYGCWKTTTVLAMTIMQFGHELISYETYYALPTWQIHQKTQFETKYAYHDQRFFPRQHLCKLL